MKKINYIVIFLLSFFVVSYNVNATTGTVNVNDSLTLRDKPNISGSIVTNFYNGTVLTVLSTNSGTGNGCSDNWYKVSYGNYTGYSCSTYITINYDEKEYISEDDSYNKSNYDTKSNYDGSIMCYEDDGDLNLRSSAGGSTTGKKVSCGESVNIKNIQESSGSCPYYYNITTSSGNTGWVCGYFVNTTKLSSTAQTYYNNNGGVDSYYTTLRNKGFPDSYLPYLAEMHARYPNWNFVAEKINLDFSKVVAGESGNGTSLLEGSAFGEGYRSLNFNTYNILKDSFSEYSDEKGWYNASEEAIAYFMDPRNYLNVKYIFAFETLGYSSNQTASVVNSVISSQGFWSSLYSSGSSGASSDIVKACSEVGISAVHVAARIKQEVSGLTTSDSRIGGSFTYNGTSYSGYYNFFNIKSNCSNCSSIYAGYAKEKGWNTPYKGIYGGASFMYNGYISVNQDTLYYEKFDVSTTDGNYTHQYMQNLAAPIQEGGTKYSGYASSLSSYLNNGVTFVIPVYNNMPNYAVTAPRVGNPNNYLKDLKVDGSTISGFSYDTYNYNVYLDSNVTSVNIGATKINNNASVNGIGTIAISSNNQTNTIKVTSQSGKVRTYNINFIRKESAKITVGEAMNNSGFKYNNNYVFGINMGTNVSQIIGNITSYNNSINVVVTNSNGVTKTNASFVTGDKVKVTGSDGTKTYTVVIYGDVSGDGKITPADYLQVKNYIMNSYSLSGAYFEAADVNRDGKITPADYLQIKDNIMGKYKISQ